MKLLSVKHSFKVLLLCSFLLVNCSKGRAQTDSAIFRIGLILPFQTASTTEKLETYAAAQDVYSAQKINLNEDAVIALDFYQGLVQALKLSQDSITIKLSVYDNWNSDSVTKEILKRPELKKMDLIIGSVSTSTAKLVADFCNQQKIANVQPFTPSKSLTADNPYHLRLAPTIDSHVDGLFLSVVDSFPGSHVIIYSNNEQRHLGVVRRLDSLFRSYNKTAVNKFTVSILNTKTIPVNDQKVSVADEIKKGVQNVVVISSFDESFVNGSLRVLHEKLAGDSTIVVYGMPTWLNSDILRLDYVNDFHAHISDACNRDSVAEGSSAFKVSYTENYGIEPGRFAYLGFDVMNFLYYNLSNYGKGFLEFLPTQHYSGAVYNFDIRKNMTDTGTLNYYENRSINVFQVDNYRLKKVY